MRLRKGLIKRTKNINDILFFTPLQKFPSANVNYYLVVNISMRCLKKMRMNKNAKDVLIEQILKAQVIPI